jgi:hypothetical protein
MDVLSDAVLLIRTGGAVSQRSEYAGQRAPGRGAPVALAAPDRYRRQLRASPMTKDDAM